MINYNSILSNHDFPVPSYLLRMSGYISWQKGKQHQQLNGLTNASVYDKNKFSDPDIKLDSLMADGPLNSLLQVLNRQADSHSFI